MKEVRIGERNVTIPRFSAFKVARSGRLIAKITKAYPTIMFDVARFERDFETSNTIKITRAMAKLPKFEPLDLSDDDFGDKDFVEFPSSPSNWQRFAAVFPQVMDVAEEDVVSLLALVLAPNKTLEEQDEDGNVNEWLRAEGRKLLHEMHGEQLIDVAIVVAEALREQFEQKIDEAGKAIAELTGGQSVTQNGNGNNSSESSIDSLARTDGNEVESSIESSGAN